MNEILSEKNSKDDKIKIIIYAFNYFIKNIITTKIKNMIFVFTIK